MWRTSCADVRVNWSVSHSRFFVHRRNIIAAMCLSILPLLSFTVQTFNLHICSISSSIVNTATAGAIATLDNIYDTSNRARRTIASLRSITPNFGTMVSLLNGSYNPFCSRDLRISLRDTFASNYSLSVLQKHNKKSSQQIILQCPLQNRENIETFLLLTLIGLKFEMPFEGSRHGKRIVWRYMSERGSRTSIVCDSHWDNESFVVGIILQHHTRKRANCQCHDSRANAVLLLRVIKNATRDCKFEKQQSRIRIMRIF